MAQRLVRNTAFTPAPGGTSRPGAGPTRQERETVMGAHKGKKKKDKGAFTRYWGQGHRLRNKLRRIRKNNGEEAALAYERSHR